MCKNGCVEFSSAEIYLLKDMCNRLIKIEDRLYAVELLSKRLDQVLGEHLG